MEEIPHVEILLTKREALPLRASSTTRVASFDAGHPDKASDGGDGALVQRNERAHACIRERLEKLAIYSGGQSESLLRDTALG